jgi:drug/metabolite transporter (DMT)-like permease
VSASWFALVLALVAALGWSLFDLLRRFLSEHMTAWALVVWVTVGALPVVAVWGATGGWWIGEGYLAPGLGSTALNVAANFAYFRSFQISPLSVTLPMLALTPVFSTLLGALWLGERLAARALVASALVVGGALLLAVRRAGEGGRAFRLERGSLLMALVAACWSGTLLLDKFALRHASPASHALVLNGGVALAGLAVLVGARRTRELAAVRDHVGLLTVSVVCGVVALGTQLHAVRALPIGGVETLKRGVGALMAVVWGRAVFDEPVTPSKLLAVAVLVGGVALLLV